MSKQQFNKLEMYRKRHKLSVVALCRELGTSNVNYYRWKEHGITGPYKKITEEFFSKHEPSTTQHFLKITPEIAVIGMACYYPGATNIKELWENILARRVQFRRILDKRLSLNDYYSDDPNVSDKSYLTKAAFIDGFEFNWSKLRIPKKTFESTDIVHWLALDTALKAFESAGYQFEDAPLYMMHKIPAKNTGVILGNTLTGEQTRSLTLRLRWPYVQKALHAALGNFGIADEEKIRVAEAMEKIYKSAFYPITEDSLSGGLANTIAGRICNYLNLKGGGYIVDGACSSSLLAVATAANALKLGEMDLVLAGGVDVSLDPFELVGFSRAGALAKDQMRVYDQRASGFVPGEGCGFVLLKRLEDAVRDKDYVYAVIKGWGISSDGKGGIMEPSSQGQATAIQRAYKLAGYTLADVDFIEGHGTGTAKGDRVELEGIAAALKAALKKKDGRQCGVTSFKSIVGHTKAAAGIGGFIKAVLAVNQRILPPTANCQQPNEVFEKDARQLYPLTFGKIYPADKLIRAGVSSAGFGGINCHITIESRSEPTKKIKPEIAVKAILASYQNTEVFVFASRTVTHLRKLIQKFKEDLRNISMAEMADLSALLNKKVKITALIKVAVVTDSPEHLYEALGLIEQKLDKGALPDGQIVEVKAKDPVTYILLGNYVQHNRVGFLYSGQGVQCLNMTRTLVERFGWARDLLKIPRMPLGDYIYKPEDKCLTKEERQAFEKRLSQTEITQPAVAFSSLVWTEFLSQLGVEPQAVGGHSLGELMAFYKGGAFDKRTLLRFAQLRGKLMAARSRSAGMASLCCDYAQAEDIVKKVAGKIVISNVNSPNQTVVSGGRKELEQVIELAKAENFSSYVLPVSNAFHSSFMEGASKRIQVARILQESFRPGKIGIYSCMDGGRIEGNVNLREYFARQVLLPVNFIKLVESMSERCDLFIEVGPGRILTDLVKAINKNKGPKCFPLEETPQNDRDLNVILAQLFIRSVKINWQELYRQRAIKPFIPVSRKKFIENQCERPLKGIEQKELLFSKLVRPALTRVEVVQKELPVSTQPTRDIGSADDIARIIMDLIHKVTGYDTQSINLNLRLLDDLNLDSIKAAELIAEAAKMLGLSGQIDPSQFSNNTLAQIRDRLAELKSQTSSTVGGADNVLLRYQRNSWVRNFVVKFEEEKIKQLDSSVFKRLNKIDILSDDSQWEIAYSLKQLLKDKRTEVRIKSYDELDKTDALGLICILPANHKKDPFGEVTLKRIIDRFYHVMETTVHDGAQEEKAVVFIQFGGGNFGENDKVNIESCCARSFASTLHLEQPGLRIRILDFDERISADTVSAKVVEEFQTTPIFSISGYDKSVVRKVPVFQDVQPVLYKKREIAWSPHDVVLVTGGAKGVTAECALEFARRTKAQMILVGRSELPKDSNDEIVRTLKRFKEERLQCQYYSCDVTNLEAVQQLVSKIAKEHGKITAVIHGAGLNTLKRLKQTNPEGAYQETLPKVMGAINICKALDKNLPKLFVGITSVIGVTGMEGSGWYGLANEILNLFLHQFKAEQKETEVIAVAYSVWDEIGMGTKLGSLDWLSQRGISPIPVAEGVKRFMQLVEGDSGSQQTIVVARIAGIDTWRSPQAEYKGNLRFIEDIKYHMPNVELIAQAHLNVKDDSYVLDHNWKGTLLFPMAFGLEAMTQAGCYITGTEIIQGLKFRNISLERPITVSQERGARIEIHAQVLETEGSDSKQIEIKIHCEQTSYKVSHFSAILEINPTIGVPSYRPASRVKNKKPIDLDLHADVYGPILFQGKTFQRLGCVYSLFYDDKRKTGECLSEARYIKSNLLIGDPYFIDSALQSMQLIIPQDICLPESIDGIELIPSRSNSGRKYIIKSSIKRMDVDHYRGDAEVSRDGFILRIRNCHLKILETLEDNPSANDLVNPAIRDQKIIEVKLGELSREFDFVPPVVRCSYDERLKGARKELRHKIELPLIQSAIEELLKRDKKWAKGFKIRWDKFGKPLVTGKNLKNIGVSVSHDGPFLLVIAGHGKQGCDVETIQERSWNDWLGVLGKNKENLLKELIVKGNDLNKTGTSTWCALESFKKCGNKDNEIQIASMSDNYFIFKSLCLGEEKVISFPIKNGKAIFSLAVGINSDQTIAKEVTKMGYDYDVFKTDVQFNGPQGQPVYIQRFPVTFKNMQNLNKTLYFSNYFDWIGEIREYALYPIKKELTRLFESGDWGMVTNHVKLQIYGQLKADDIVEGRIWFHKISGDKNSVLDLMFDWLKILPNKTYERVATSEQRVSWIKIVGYGDGKIESFPEQISRFIKILAPQKQYVDSCTQYKMSGKSVEFGKERFSAGRVLNKEFLLKEEVFSTSLEESNLVGNIYFSNYAKWLGKVRDNYFREVMSDYFFKKEGRLICLNCDIYYLMEAMPFDSVKVKMYVNQIYDYGLNFYFEFLQAATHGGRTEGGRLAYATHRVIFSKGLSNKLTPEVLPKEILDNLDKFIVIKVRE